MPSSRATSPVHSTAAGLYYIDTSVAIRIALGQSDSASRWFDQAALSDARFVSSRLLELEMIRVMRRESLDVDLATSFTEGLTMLAVNDQLLIRAAAIRHHIKSLDALHLASAQLIGAGYITVVSHDANMLRVADQLGFDAVDPVIPL